MPGAGTCTIDAEGRINSVTITNAGLNYTSPPTIQISGLGFAILRASLIQGFGGNIVLDYDFVPTTIYKYTWDLESPIELNENEKNNPFAINLYLLGYDNAGRLTQLNRAVKENLKTYLNEYKILTDGVNILDGFVINIGIDFEIICYESYNKSEVLINCINELKDYFIIDNWTFNQTINLSEIELLLANVEGVQSVPMIKITNKCGDEYTPHSYNIDAATKDKIVYPSLDPSVFEVKYPDKDIKGRVR